MAALQHESLLTLARRMQAAATDADAVRLDHAAREFSCVLGAHLTQEARSLLRLPPPEARLLRRGQERLWAAAQAYTLHARGGCPQPPGRCVAQAEEVVALLTLQAKDERLALHDPAA